MEEKQEECEIESRLAALSEIAGSMKDVWSGVDALEWQNELREERVIG